MVAQDVELWFENLRDPCIRESPKEVDGVYAAPCLQNPPLFISGGVELFDLALTIHGLGTFAEELWNCVDVALGRHKLKILRLDRILASKRAANCAKYRPVIPVLEDSLAAGQVSARRKASKAANPRRRRSLP